jgi:CRP-like cAMP-binding protein
MRAFLREQPQHAIQLVGQVMAQHATLLEKLRELATLSVEQRLVAALARMAMHQGFLDADGRITLDAARYRLLCEMVGATRESVSLVLNRLVGEGLAERQGASFTVAPAATLVERASPSWREAEVSLLVSAEHSAKQVEA